MYWQSRSGTGTGFLQPMIKQEAAIGLEQMTYGRVGALGLQPQHSILQHPAKKLLTEMYSWNE